jgi:protein O-mannosyl-transferase
VKISDRHFRILTAVSIATLSLLVYGTKLHSDFVLWDDDFLIEENPAVHALTPATLKMIFTTYDPELYIPVTLFTYQINYLIAGLDPFVYHLTNLLLHIGSALLVSVVAWYLSRGDRRIAAASGLLFAVLPIHVEAVMWASARKDVLASFFALLSVWLYFLYHTKSSQLYLCLSVAVFLLGLLSKVSIAALPLVLLIMDWMEERPLDRRAVLEKVPYLLLSIVFVLVALAGKSEQVVSSTFTETMLVGVSTAMLSLGRLFLPVALSPLYPLTGPISIASATFAVLVILFIILCVTLFLLRKGPRVLPATVLSYFLLLAPSLANFRKGEGDVYLGSDRYVYLASIPVLLAIITLLSVRLPRRAANAVITFMIILCAFISYRQADIWHNSKTLFTHVLAHYPQSEVAHHNLGSVYQQQGDFQKAMDEYRAAIAITPRSTTYANIGDMFRERGMLQEAEIFYLRALELKSQSADAFIGLGLLAMQRQDTSMAIEYFRQAVAVRPADFHAHLNLGAALMQKGMAAEAIDEYLLALSYNPRSATAFFNLGGAYRRLGNTDDAKQAFDAAVSIDPSLESAVPR